MTKEQAFEIGLQLNNIAMLVDDANLARIKPQIDRIEQICLDAMEGSNEDRKDATGTQG